MYLKILLPALAAGIVLSCATPALAWSPKLAVDENTWAQVGVLGQFQFEAKQDNAGTNGDQWSNGAFVRRFRLLMQGSVHKNVQFLFDTDIPNAGKSADFGQPAPQEKLILNDAFVDFNLVPALKFEVGRILLPFSYENKQSATALLGLDYNLNAIKIPTFSEPLAAWRDNGVEARGLLLNNLIDYRVGVFTGQRDNAINPDDHLRYTGHVMLNLAEAQPGWFYSNSNFGKQTIRSLGVGFDMQDDATPVYTTDTSVSPQCHHAGPAAQDYRAWEVDGQLEQPLGNGQAISASAAWFDWEHAAGDFSGNTAFAQAGYLVTPHWQPVLRWEHQDPRCRTQARHLSSGHELSDQGAQCQPQGRLCPA